MALDNLIATIQESTQTEVEVILAAARARVAEAEKQAEDRARIRFEQERERLRSNLQYAAAQQRSQREIEIRQTLLRERETRLDEVQARLRAWLESLPPAEEAQWLQKLLAAARIRVPGGVLVMNPRTAACAGSVADFRVELDDRAEDGMLARSADGRVTVDLTYPSLLQDFWARRRPDIARALFGSAMNLSEVQP